MMTDEITVLRTSEKNEDRLFAFAAAAMEKLILLKPTKTGIEISCDTKMAWDIAAAMMKEKARLDEQVAKGN